MVNGGAGAPGVSVKRSNRRERGGVTVLLRVSALPADIVLANHASLKIVQVSPLSADITLLHRRSYGVALLCNKDTAQGTPLHTCLPINLS